MCGRFTLKTPPAEIAEHFGLTDVPDLEPRYNVAPTQDVAIVRAEGSGRRLDLVRWGLLSGGRPDQGAPLINARSETVHERPAFREAYRERRCLVPADGFFEWLDVGGRRQPMYFRRVGGKPFAFAGLWDRVTASDGGVVESCTILTTEPNALVRPVHDRMPVILPVDGYARWLGVADPDALRVLFHPFPQDDMESFPVNPVVNRADHDAPDCVRPHQYIAQTDLFG